MARYDVTAGTTATSGSRLSRFVVIHRDGGAWVAESPVTTGSLRIFDPAVLAELHEPSGQLLEDLQTAGLVTDEDGTETLTEGGWRTPDLWLHQRSRLNPGDRFNETWGATGWGADKYDMLPARRESFGRSAFDLYAPDLDKLRESDSSFTEVLEDRRSIREHDEWSPLTAEQLGEFLFRCARVRGVEDEHVDRPFPSGGGLHELELYPVIRNVEGIEPGLYHYDGHDHRLEHVSDLTLPVQQLLSNAAQASFADEPQVLIVVAARFGRVMRHYEGMAYALILKDTGALYQTMYLVATSMGLSACALGGGDSTSFTAATGVDYLVESQVGEFILGSRPEFLEADLL